MVGRPSNIQRYISEVDTLLISGGSGVNEACRNKNLIAFVQKLSEGAWRVVPICNGAFILVTAGVDPALFLVEKDCGRHVSLCIAKNLVMFMKRQGGQSQLSSRLAKQYVKKSKLKDLIEWIKTNHTQNITIKDLSGRACTSE